MTLPARLPPRRRGFTLVELLTVVGIIALLIGILMPSLSRARTQARIAATAAVLKAGGDGLEMFHNDFGQYADSTLRPDAVLGLPDGQGGTLGDGLLLSGAHWLARALLGHDFQGVDADGLVLRTPGEIPDPPGAANFNVNYLLGVDRKGTYLDPKALVRDTDPQFNQAGSPSTGRPVVFDTFDYPVIYYRANSRAKQWLGPIAPAIYVHEDNAAITGGAIGGEAVLGWDFAAAGIPVGYPVHPMGQIGNYNPIDNYPYGVHDPPLDGESKAIKGKTFADYLHSHKAGDIGGVLKPVNAETFILVSPGPDGVFGTRDDVNNFSGAL